MFPKQNIANVRGDQHPVVKTDRTKDGVKAKVWPFRSMLAQEQSPLQLGERTSSASNGMRFSAVAPGES